MISFGAGGFMNGPRKTDNNSTQEQVPKFTKSQISAMAKLFYEGEMELDEKGNYKSSWPGERGIKAADAKWLIDNKLAKKGKGFIKSTPILSKVYNDPNTPHE